MKSFLGVPIVLRGVAYGNLYLTEKEGGADFTDEDEELVTLLASQAAVAIENARLYESSRAWARQLESLEEITAAMLSDIDPARLLHLIVAKMSDLIDARFVGILTQVGEGWLEIAAAHGEGEQELVGHRLAHRALEGRPCVPRRNERAGGLGPRRSRGGSRADATCRREGRGMGSSHHPG